MFGLISLMLLMTSAAEIDWKAKNESMSDSACREALDEYSIAVGNLQRCSMVNILPSNICQKCLLDYAKYVHILLITAYYYFIPVSNLLQKSVFQFEEPILWT